MKPFLMWAVVVLALNVPRVMAAPAATGDPDAGQTIVTKVCAACHGADGNSASGMYPDLAGQHAVYIERQLNAFKSGARKSPVMAAMAAPLSAADIRNVAAYFAAQTPKPGAARLTPDDLAMAQKLYRGGNAAEKVPACAACHGPTGAGIPVLFPRLSGQHSEYVAAQLQAFRSGARGVSGPGQMMAQIASRLTDKEIAVISQYVAGLH